MSGQVQVVVAGPNVGRGNAEVMAEFRQDFDDELYGTWVARSDDFLGELSARVRLAPEGLISQPVAQPDERGYVQLSVPLESDRDRWVAEGTYSGPVCMVENFGVGMLYPRVVWTRGGAVVMPSGAGFTLPTVSEPRVIDFHPRRSGLVTDLAGEIDHELWVKLRGFYFEGVPRRAVRRYSIPSGATLVAPVPMREPWR
nr:MAG TPA: hypothetical protein [Caudoviricetes sp.]